jgi:hypothetical protein
MTDPVKMIIEIARLKRYLSQIEKAGDTCQHLALYGSNNVVTDPDGSELQVVGFVVTCDIEAVPSHKAKLLTDDILGEKPNE